MLLPLCLGLGERIIPSDWTFVVILALSSQVIGQGLLVYALGALSPLVVGLTLLTQPAISALVGWLAYGETLSPLDWLGAAAIGAALVPVSSRSRSARMRCSTAGRGRRSTAPPASSGSILSRRGSPCPRLRQG